MSQSSDLPDKQRQSQDIAIGGNLQIEGQSHHLDFSQTNIDLSQAQIVQTQIVQFTSAEEIKNHPLIESSPYKGLKKFESEDKDYFFGRDDLVQAIVQDLEQSNLLLLYGASGSGKSSVVQAGLIPELRQRWGTTFIELTMKPDRNPFVSLFAALLRRGYGQTAAEIALTAQSDTLKQVVKTLKRPSEQWLFYFDQFEEIFTLSEPEKRDTFVQSIVSLYRALEQSLDRSVKLVMTMRAEFLDRFSPDLDNVTRRNLRLVGDLQPNDLRLAITEPAKRHGVVFEAKLVGIMIADLSQQTHRGFLPLLQYTLDLLWQKSKDHLANRVLLIQTYHSLGGVRGALQQHVNKIYESLTPAEQAITRRIFLRLVDIQTMTSEPDEAGQVVSHRAELTDLGDASIKPILDKLIDANLLVSDRPQRVTIEIAHEALIDAWPALKHWITESKAVIKLNNQLEEDARKWSHLLQQAPAQADDELWRGSRLEKVLELERDDLFQIQLGGLSPEVKQFLEASIKLRDRQQRFYRNVAVSAVIAMVCILGVGTLAIAKWRAADRGEIRALITSSDAKFNENPDTFDALIEALSASRHLQDSLWFRHNPQFRAEVMQVLGQAVYWVRERDRIVGHTGSVQHVSFSPDGQTIATSSYDHTVKLWNLDGTDKPIVIQHTGAVVGVSFSPDGRIIATASQDGTAQLWDAATGNHLHTLDNHVGVAVRSITFSPDNTLIATGSDDGKIRLWTKDGQPLPFVDPQSNTSAILSLSFSQDGSNNIIDGRANGIATLWTKQGTLIKSLDRHIRYASNNVSVSSSKNYIVTADIQGAVRLWSKDGIFLQSLAEPNSLQPTRGFTQVQFSPDGNTIAASVTDGSVKMWDLEGREIATLRGHDDRVNGISFSPTDHHLLASVSNDQSLILWQLDYQPRLQVLTEHRSGVSAVRFLPDGQATVSAGADRSILLWNTEGASERQLGWHNNSILSLSIDRTQPRIASASRDRTVRIWNWQSNQLVHTLPKQNSQVNSVSFSPDGQILASANAEGEVKLWNPQNGEPISTHVPKQDKSILGLSFSPDGEFLATANDDSTVKLWRLDGTSSNTLSGHTAGVWDVSFSPDGQQIATASKDGTAIIWDRNGNILHRLVGHTAAISRVSFSPDGLILATGSDDKTIKLWDLNGNLITTLTGHQNAVNDLDFDPQNGDRLVSGSADQTVILWNLADLDLTRSSRTRDLPDNLIKTGCLWLKNYVNHNPEAPQDICD